MENAAVVVVSLSLAEVVHFSVALFRTNITHSSHSQSQSVGRSGEQQDVLEDLSRRSHLYKEQVVSQQYVVSAKEEEISDSLEGRRNKLVRILRSQLQKYLD